jgi:tetratricopeptide (TPR) repeat protein
MDLLKTDRMGLASKMAMMALAMAIIALTLGWVHWFNDDGSFARGIITSIFGTFFSIAVGVMVVSEIIKKDQEMSGQKKAKQANVELLNSINGGHLNFVKLDAELGKLERWTTEWGDGKETTFALINFYGVIEREENSLYVHTKRAMGYAHPVVESKKEAYLYCLRQLRTITHSLAISQNKSENSAKFKIAGCELFTTKFSLMNALENAIAIDNAIELSPNDASLNTAKGFYQSNHCKWNEAIQCFDKATELDSQYAYAWIGKGVTLEALGRPTEAEAAFAKAKELGYAG